MHKHYSITVGFQDQVLMGQTGHACSLQGTGALPRRSVKTALSRPSKLTRIGEKPESPRAFGWRVFCAFTVQSVTGHVVLPTSSSARWMACQQLPQKMLQHACSGCLPTVCGAFGDSTSSMIPKRCSRRRHKGRAVACS